MSIIRKANGTEIPAQAQRIFISSSSNHSVDRDKIIDDLLQHIYVGIECVVSYLETTDSHVIEDQIIDELQETQLFVLLVTPDMLNSVADGDYPVEYRIARELNIPVLPILKDNGLFQIFRKSFGAIHCISTADETYSDKLKAQLELFLASAELIKQINEKAFAYKLFLSYRRRNIAEARRLMRVIHSLEEYEAACVWYDNFLTAGSDFDDDILKSITGSDAFVLLITPHILETENNYVQKTEYPYARKIGKPVVAVEAISTELSCLIKLFPGIQYTVQSDDTIGLNEAFRSKLGETVYAGRHESERAYLLGMAYLKSINVERDINKAVKFLEITTEECSEYAIKAAKQLADIYENGLAANVDGDDAEFRIDHNRALYWREKAVVYSEKTLGLDHIETGKAYSEIGYTYFRLGEYKESLKYYRRFLKTSLKSVDDTHKTQASFNGKVCAGDAYNNIGHAYFRLGKYEDAKKNYESALKICMETVGEDHQNTALIYDSIGGIYDLYFAEYEKALEFYHKAKDILERTIGARYLRTAVSYGNIAGVYDKLGDYVQAREWYLKALKIREDLFGREHTDTVFILSCIAGLDLLEGNHKTALKGYFEVYEIRAKIFGEDHLQVASVCNNIAFTYDHLREFDDAYKWHKRTLEIKERTIGEDHLSTAITYSNIAAHYFDRENYGASEEYYNKALKIRESKLGGGHPDTAKIYHGLAAVLNKLERTEESLLCYLKAYRIRKSKLGNEHCATADTLSNIRDLYGQKLANNMTFENWIDAKLSE